LSGVSLFLELNESVQNSRIFGEIKQWKDIGLSFFRIVRQKRPHLVYLTAICQMPSEKFKVDFPYQAGFISHLFVFLTFKKP
jgi:hypothetical protein